MFLKEIHSWAGKVDHRKRACCQEDGWFVPWGTQVWGEAAPVSCPLNYTHMHIHNITFKNLKYICCSLLKKNYQINDKS